MKDKYDIAIEYFTEHQNEIADAWMDPQDYPGGHGCLFQFVTPDGGLNAWYGRLGGHKPGCLTQIRHSEEFCAVSPDGERMPELTKLIHEDDRLPVSHNGITLSSLPVFAEYQRQLDKNLRSLVK